MPIDNMFSSMQLDYYILRIGIINDKFASVYFLVFIYDCIFNFNFITRYKYSFCKL